MKVTLVNKLYPPKIGGIEYHVRQLALEFSLIDEITKINILVANESANFSREVESDKITITRLPSYATIQSTPIAPGFVNWFGKMDCDLFHFQFPYPFGDVAWLLSGDKRPYIVTYQSDILRQRFLGKLYSPFMHMFLDKAAKIITTSPQMVDSSAILQKYKQKVEIIPLGIDPAPFLPSKKLHDLSQVIKAKYARPIILFVGRLVYYKGVDVLIKAMKEIEADLLLVGKGPLEQSLRELAAELGIADKVHFCPPVDDEMLSAYYTACDLFVLPSVAKTEAFGLVQIEAHACGKPVISTNLPTGVPYVNQHGVSGLVVPPSDVAALAEALKTLVDDEALRTKLGENAKKRMMETFTSKVMAGQVYALYKSILK